MNKKVNKNYLGGKMKKWKKTSIKTITFTFLFCFISRIIELVCTNTQTYVYLNGLKNGNNSVAEATQNLPHIISEIFVLLAAIVFVSGIIKIIKEIKENK